MSAKLTLRINPLLIKIAKVYAKKNKKSVSQIVGDYFSLLTYSAYSLEKKSRLPITKSLQGALKKHKPSKKDYHHYLEKKYL